MEDLLPAKVVLVESFMPTAIMAVLLVKIFRLNEDLANAAWILTTLLVIPVIPGMLFLCKSIIKCGAVMF
jgi:predicted permease